MMQRLAQFLELIADEPLSVALLLVFVILGTAFGRYFWVAAGCACK
jgi:hypothetical protein